jgi:hypothetical protein
MGKCPNAPPCELVVPPAANQAGATVHYGLNFAVQFNESIGLHKAEQSALHCYQGIELLVRIELLATFHSCAYPLPRC